MPYKDPEKQMEWKREWREKNREKRSIWNRNKYKESHPNAKSRTPNIMYYDFETHHALAMNSGIISSREWDECYKMGLMPDGIYRKPDHVFGRK